MAKEPSHLPNIHPPHEEMGAELCLRVCALAGLATPALAAACLMAILPCSLSPAITLGESNLSTGVHWKA